MKLLIEIPEEQYRTLNAKSQSDVVTAIDDALLIKAIKNGKVLPKGYGKLITEAEILKFLKCPKYENCDWRNCSDCNESRCINFNNVNGLVSIIEEDKAESER